MTITASEFISNSGRYLELVETEDIFVTKNGKTIAKIVNPNVSPVDSLRGLLKDSPDTDRHKIREERLAEL